MSRQDEVGWNHSERESSNLTERVYHKLREDILSGHYHEGDALTEMSVAKELSVSRTPVREALRELELEGLVELRPNRGAVVKEITEQDIRDIYEIRAVIESMAAERAAETATEEELQELEDTLDLTQFYLDRNNYEKLQSMDGLFHQQLYDMCKSRMLSHILKDLHHYVGRSRGASLKIEGRAQASIDEHRAILEALRAHDPAAAKARMTEHVNNTSANVTKLLVKEKEGATND